MSLPPGMLSRKWRPPREGLFALARSQQLLNQSIFSQHISLLAHDRKKCHYIMPLASCVSQMRAPTNGGVFELFLALDSLCYLFRKKIHRLQFPCPDFSSTSPNYSGVVVHLLLLLKYFNITIVVVVVWMLMMDVCSRLHSFFLPSHLLFSPLLSFTRLKARARRSPSSPAAAAAYSCGGAAAASAAASSPSPAVSEVHSVRLSRSSCMIRVLSL